MSSLYSNNQAVFNCVLNGPALKKKKKIPSVLPAPPPGAALNPGVKAAIPFWKEPLPDRATTPLDEIRQKLQTKRDNQLRQLQLIESEIRAGHIKRPPMPPSLGGQHVHRDPGVKHHQPYLYISDPHNDSSGDQGTFLNKTEKASSHKPRIFP
jgi:hypothetical protein